MRILKTIFIASLVILIIIIIGVYFSLPLLIKMHLPEYANNNFVLKKFGIQKAYYSSFDTLEIKNVTFKLDNPGILVWVNIPKVTFSLKKLSISKNFILLKFFHPVILSKINKNKFKEGKSKKSVTIPSITNNKLFQYISRNTVIEGGIFLFKNIKIKKLNIKDLKGELNYKNHQFSLLLSGGKLFNGKVSGNIKIKIKKNQILHIAKLDLSKINIKKVEELIQPEDYNFKGIYSGKLFLEGKNLNIHSLNGNLTSSGKGGEISIKSNKIKNFINKKENEKVELAIKQLRNFSYNKGSISLKTIDKNLILHTIFKGPKGKKNIKFVFHDYLDQIQSILVK